MRNPQPTDGQLREIYSPQYFLGSNSEVDSAEAAHLKGLTADRYLDQIEAYANAHGNLVQGGSLLEIGCGTGNLLLAAKRRGHKVAGVEVSESAVRAANEKLGDDCVHCGEIQDAPLPPQRFDICVLADVIEHTRDPVACLEHVYRLLKPGGILFVAVPSLDSWSAKLMRTQWSEFKTEHLFYFNGETARSILFRFSSS